MEEIISIIVPCYNIENYIERTVRSICNQTYPYLDIVLVDDGSQDSTLSVLKKLEKQDKRIKVVQKQNGGVTSARLEGVKKAHGDWIGFVDGDDIVEPHMYERLLENAHKYNADISHCGYQMVFPSRIDYYYNTGRLVQQDKITGLKDLLSGEFIEPGLCNKLFHKTLFHSLLHDNVMDLSIKNYEDLLMNFYLFRKSENAIYEDFCPYHYIIRENSATTADISPVKICGPWRVFSIIHNEVKEHPLLRYVINVRLSAYLTNVATMRIDKDSSEIRKLSQKARKELWSMLPELLSNGYGRRTKILSLWACCFPAFYRFAHKMYSMIRGTDKKYEIS